MKATYRYGSLALGFIVFLLFIPYMIGYVTGKKNLSRQSESTGIFAIRTTPVKADVYLNGSKVDTTPADLKFLSQGFYEISLQKSGYKAWRKTLQIIPGKVTWVNPEPLKLFMFPESPQTQNLESDVLDIETTGQDVFALKTGFIHMYSFADGSLEKTLTVPITMNQIRSWPGATVLLLSDGKQLVGLNVQNGQVQVLGATPDLFSTISITRDGSFVYTRSKILYVETIGAAPATLATNVLSSYALGYGVYYVSKENGQVVLKHMQVSGSGSPVQTLDKAIPCPANCAIYVAGTKQIFIKSANVLYRLSDGWASMGDQVSNVVFDSSAPSLAYQNAGELNFYDFSEQKIWLIDRTGSQAQNMIFRGDLGYFFHLQNGSVQLLELDRRGEQNYYSYSDENPVAKFFLSEDGKRIALLAGNTVKLLTIVAE
ncbi:MAG TPA: PEGA domain-containing protein [Patescibacteria group bacterium]|nr:PEGA domain-containing protein [Patescibacteria group bacterium]